MQERRINPVSYTHLDVYKRQLSHPTVEPRIAEGVLCRESPIFVLWYHVTKSPVISAQRKFTNIQEEITRI